MVIGTEYIHVKGSIESQIVGQIEGIIWEQDTIL
jgi:hypothetical protein